MLIAVLGSAATLTALGATSLVLGLCSLWIRGRLFLTNSVMAMTIGELANNNFRQGLTEMSSCPSGIILGPKVLE